MVKVVYGPKGSGKTKLMLDTANRTAADSKGDICFIDDSKQLMYDLNGSIRFVDVSEFPAGSDAGFLGFICGIIAQDYDINAIFIDGLTSIINRKPSELEGFFKSLDEISAKFGMDFYVSISAKTEDIPEFLKSYLLM